MRAKHSRLTAQYVCNSTNEYHVQLDRQTQSHLQLDVNPETGTFRTRHSITWISHSVCTHTAYKITGCTQN
jgi:hypothetical protein